MEVLSLLILKLRERNRRMAVSRPNRSFKTRGTSSGNPGKKKPNLHFSLRSHVQIYDLRNSFVQLFFHWIIKDLRSPF